MNVPVFPRAHEVMLADCYDQLNMCSSIMTEQESTQRVLVVRLSLAKAMGLVQMVRRDLLEGGHSEDELPF